MPTELQSVPFVRLGTDPDFRSGDRQSLTADDLAIGISHRFPRAGEAEVIEQRIARGEQGQSRDDHNVIAGQAWELVKSDYIAVLDDVKVDPLNDFANFSGLIDSDYDPARRDGKDHIVVLVNGDQVWRCIDECHYLTFSFSVSVSLGEHNLAHLLGAVKSEPRFLFRSSPLTDREDSRQPKNANTL